MIAFSQIVHLAWLTAYGLFLVPQQPVKDLLQLLGYLNCSSCICLYCMGVLSGRVGKNSPYDYWAIPTVPAAFAILGCPKWESH